MDLPKLILASGSPRRSEILGFVGWEFEKRVAEVDETPIEGEPAEIYVERLALEKANAVAGNLGKSLVLGADTTVVIDDKIIGKPVDLEDARNMIAELSGRWHEVITGVALVSVSDSETRSVSGIQRTGVKFADLSESEIAYLVEYGEPLDKAGAYAVQAQAALFIEEIRGDYWNVVGLPVNLVYRLLEAFRKN
jgi:septum formation protein